VIVTEHYTRLKRVFNRIDGMAVYQHMLTRTDVLICVSEMLRRQILGRFPWAADKVVVVPNVVDVHAMSPRPAPPESLDRWLYIGRLVAQKRVEAVLEALAVYRRDRPAASLSIVGDGPDEAALRARAQLPDLAGAVDFVGSVPPDEVRPLLHAHDVLVHLSSVETFGITIAEAVASGTPVVVTRCGGPEEILGGGVEPLAGTLVPLAAGADDVAAAVLALEARLPELDPGAAREAMVLRYSPEAVAGALLRLYAQGTS
jgi:glycogen(starch) synthase